MSAPAKCSRCGRGAGTRKNSANTLIWSKFSHRHYCADFAACDRHVARTKRELYAERAW